ncbi:serine hydrolase domain-containing protein [Nonomuraea sediminis]|uniref:serine hydrolase domain-containing protein n=1 Tax=Nonomuraea sediminis TaxID=2835864 RepID=UPI001BDD8F3B|nr:serine hydrolase domain-containing protein [Nonomuraea sediminis]
MRYSIVWLMVAALLAVPKAQTDFPDLNPTVTARLDAAIRKVMREAEVPGVIVGLSAPGKGSYVRAFGVADKATNTSMTPDLNMRIGSVTKTFTVTALLELVDQGKVGLDDPIAKYVDGVPNGDRITLRNLAQMRSGLFNYTLDEGFDKALLSDPTRPFTPQELLAYSFKHPVQFQPGERFQYSNTNTILLGLVVEKIGGQPLQDYIHKNVAEKAGLTHTIFPTDATFPSPHAHGYTKQTETGAVQDATDWNPSWGWAAGAMISDLPDLQNWARVLATGTLLTAKTQAERLKMPPSGIPGTGYGLGIFNVQGWIGHNGSLPGYEALVIYLPEAKATLVVLLNTDILKNGQEPSTLFGQAITQVVTPDHVFNLPVGVGASTSPSGTPSPQTSAPSPQLSTTPTG